MKKVIISVLTLLVAIVVIPLIYVLQISPDHNNVAMERFNQSKQFNGKVFLNALDTRVSTGSYWEVIKNYVAGPKRVTQPKKQVEINRLNEKDFTQIPSQNYKVTWLGHSSFLLEMDQKRILVDPVFSERVSMFSWLGPKRFYDAPVSTDEIPLIDAVIISHDHYDHLDKTTIKNLGEQQIHFYAPLGVGSHLKRWGIKEELIHEFDWWDSFQLGSLEIHCTPARHFSGRGLLDRNETLWASWTFIGSKQKVFYSGDTGMMPTFKTIGEKFGPFDLTLMQVGAYDENWSEIHMFPHEAVEAQKQLQGKVMIPIHWGTFDLALHDWFEPAKQLKELAKNESWQLTFPEIGEVFYEGKIPEINESFWWEAYLENQ